MVQFIGGEPTLDPDLPRLVRHALGKGLKVYVYSNLVHVTRPLWELFSQPGMLLGTSWYSADPGKHAEITGSRASYARTRASIAEAVRRGIPVRAAIVEITKDQGIEQAAAELRRLGVTDIRVRPSQGMLTSAPAARPTTVLRPATATTARPLRAGEMTGRMDWEPHAEQLAGEVTDPMSRWRPLVASTPRHVFVPRWWQWADPQGWTAWEGPADARRWMNAAYCDRTLITRLGPAHADHAQPGDHPDGRPTSSATQPGLVVQMYRHAGITDGADILDVGTGSGYGCALLARRLGDVRVTSVDVDDYLVKAAAERLAGIGLHPDVTVCDATGPLPGSYDRIVSMMSVTPVPASWLAALRPGGRLVTVLAGTGLIVTADKMPDGGAAGRIEWDRAGFMAARSGPDYPPSLLDEFPAARDGEGEQVSAGRYPVVSIGNAWELYSMLGVTVPGVQDHYQESGDGQRTAWLLHPDGSWARATGTADGPPVVCQSGPRRLWDTVDDIRHAWLRDGKLPAYGASVTITPDGSVHLKRGRWQATIPAAG